MENESGDEGLGARIARLRNERRMTQQAVADAADTTREQIAALERGTPRNPGVQSLIGIARALSVTLDELVGLPVRSPGPQLTDALELLVRRTATIGREPYDMFTPAEFAEWSLGTSLTYGECLTAWTHLMTEAIPSPDGDAGTLAGAYFVTGAVAGAMLERWRR
jgi:transcriptional regulator with XRE-family HTH domain